MDKEDAIKVKVNGTEKSVRKFLDKLDKTYGLILVGKIMPNDTGNQFHCFASIDVSTEVTRD